VSWWPWLLLWFVLLLLALGLVAVVALRVFRKGRALLSEIAAASDRLAAVADQIQEGQAEAAASHVAPTPSGRPPATPRTP
jgi:hypothetical protein